MTQQSILLIGDFVQMTELSVQTLRYYHQQGLLVPADIGESGYRGYTFDQTHQALLIMALRRAGVGIGEIRTILDSPELLPGALSKHQAKLISQRTEQDDAMAQAWQLAKGWPQAALRRNQAGTSIIRRVPSEVATPNAAALPHRVRDAAQTLRDELVDAGVLIVDPPWCQYALQTSEDKQQINTPQGPDWLVAVNIPGPRNAPGSLPSGTDILSLPGCQEFSVHLPNAPTMVAYAAAVEYLVRTMTAQDLVPDFSRLRYVLERDHVELALAVASSESG